MKTYPTISPVVPRGTSVYVFDKLDGSNIRAEWSRKKGFWKFGRRKALLDDSNPHLVQAPQLVLDKYGDLLPRIFRGLRAQKATAFFELWGPSSFAGNHEETEAQTVTLIDVAIHPKGILPPKLFLKHFGDVEHAAMLHHGAMTADLEQQIREGTLPGMSVEGVVAKGPLATPGRPLMFKVKTRAWLDRLRTHCDGDEALFEKLR